jgi:hypothetical protein
MRRFLATQRTRPSLARPADVGDRRVRTRVGRPGGVLDLAFVFDNSSDAATSAWGRHVSTARSRLDRRVLAVLAISD